ncbi:MAG: transferase [Parasporobacterium sp.]|nr:transferase [Parasporobacterium sp.]
MEILRREIDSIKQILFQQLKLYWPETNENIILEALPKTIDVFEEGFKGLPNKRYYNGTDVLFSPYFSVQWMIFLYRLSHEIYLRGVETIPKEADQIYYLNKIMHSNDWFYAINLPTHFLCEHPLGSVLGRAEYGDYLFVYQGTTIGGSRKKEELFYPRIGNNVILFADSAILGNSVIGNNVVVSANTHILNENIPDNSIVFGQSPNLIIKRKCEKEILAYTKHIWGWNELI